MFKKENQCQKHKFRYQNKFTFLSKICTFNAEFALLNSLFMFCSSILHFHRTIYLFDLTFYVCFLCFACLGVVRCLNRCKYRQSVFLLDLRTFVCYNIRSATILGRRLVLLTEDWDLWWHRNLLAEILWNGGCAYAYDGFIYLHHQPVYYLLCARIHDRLSKQ